MPNIDEPVEPFRQLVRRNLPDLCKAAAVCFATLVFFSAVVAVFLSQIKDLGVGVQEKYIIDGYYYYYLGHTAITMSEMEGMTLRTASEALQPNESSGGIVFITALVERIAPSPFCVATILALVYSALLFLLLRTKMVRPLLLFLPFTGLFPYLPIPSKEGFLIIGGLCCLLAYLNRRMSLLWPPGLLLIYLARPDVLYVFLFSILLVIVVRSRIWSVLFATAGLAAYFIWIRQPAALLAIVDQAEATVQQTQFCHIGPLSLCIEPTGIVEVIYAQRLLSLVGLPLKWAWEAASAIFLAPTATDLIIRIAIGLHIIWAIKIMRHDTPADKQSTEIRNITMWFAGVYVFLYGSIVYFQSTRQVVFASTIFLIGRCVKQPDEES